MRPCDAYDATMPNTRPSPGLGSSSRAHRARSLCHWDLTRTCPLALSARPRPAPPAVEAATEHPSTLRMPEDACALVAMAAEARRGGEEPSYAPLASGEGGLGRTAESEMWGNHSHRLILSKGIAQIVLGGAWRDGARGAARPVGASCCRRQCRE